jgi:hypothetical protein
MKRPRGKAKLEQVEDDLCLPFLFDLQPLHSSLQYIQTHSHCQDILHFIQQHPVQMIGIDTETEPSYGHKTSLIQLAVRFTDHLEVIYIFDLLTLSQSVKKGKVKEEESLSPCNEILTLLCSDESIVKIAHGLKQDAEELLASYPTLTGLSHIVHVIETNALHQKLHPQVTALVSLKYLTRQYLHSNLVKAHQCSSWGTRPLTSGQLNYAACDALVLLRLYDAMCFEIEDLFPDCDLSDCVTSLSLPSTQADILLVPLQLSSKKRQNRLVIGTVDSSAVSVSSLESLSPQLLTSPLSLLDENFNLSNEKISGAIFATESREAVTAAESSQKKRKKASKGTMEK